MHKHEGIVVVAYKPGQPRSETEAALCSALLDDLFVSHVQSESEVGLAAKVNLLADAEDLADDLAEAGVSCIIIQHGDRTDWRWPPLRVCGHEHATLSRTRYASTLSEDKHR